MFILVNLRRVADWPGSSVILVAILTNTHGGYYHDRYHYVYALQYYYSVYNFRPSKILLNLTNSICN